MSAKTIFPLHGPLRAIATDITHGAGFFFEVMRHRQQDATKARPFYSVGYQYEYNPWTLWSLNRYGWKNPLAIGAKGRTQSRTDSLDEAKREADKLVTLPGISSAVVSMTEDCYNHETVYATGKDAAKWKARETVSL